MHNCKILKSRAPLKLYSASTALESSSTIKVEDKLAEQLGACISLTSFEVVGHDVRASNKGGAYI
jgi:hypothetical protein